MLFTEKGMMRMNFPKNSGLENMVLRPIKSDQMSLAESNYASEFHKRLVEMIINFEKDLDNEHEIGARLVNFGQTIQFHIQDISYYNPSLIVFIGTMDDGSKVELIQHVNQISFLLVGMKKFEEEKPARRIGFELQKSE